MYQFWLNTADDDVVAYLRYFTFLSREEVEALARAAAEAPEQRAGQRALARDATALVHGAPAAAEAEAISHALFSGDVGALSEGQLDQACRAMPTTAIPGRELDRMPVLDLLIRLGLAVSRREGRDLLSAGAIAINGSRVSGMDTVVTPDMARFGRFLVVRKGKKSYRAATIA
jgi:tyrosyl-tRNA synthetase